MEKKNQKTALVTGAGTGLGKAIAIMLAKNGYHVILNGRTHGKLEAVAKEMAEGSSAIVPGDVTDEKSVGEIREQVLGLTDNKLDLLVNNVGGVPHVLPVTEMSLEQFQDTIHKNLTSQFLMTKAFLPALRRSEGGKIISITSGMAHFYMEGFSAYSAGKAAVEAFIKVVAEEEKKNGIEVKLFDPGNVISEANPNGEEDAMEAAKRVQELL